MVSGILIAICILIFGFVLGLTECDSEPIYAITILLSVLMLMGTLVATAPPSSAVDELKKLQEYCVSIGVATMTPVITENKFTILPNAEAPVQLPYVTATKTISTGGSHE